MSQNDQKLERARFRLRAEQVKAVERMIVSGRCEQRGHDFTSAYLSEQFAEAEARGAAEARARPLRKGGQDNG